MDEMREVGQVVKNKGKLVVVRFSRKSSCDHCGMCAFKPNDSHVDMTLENTLDCNIGDKVEVNISNGTVLKMSLLVYTIPLLVGLLGFLAAYFLKLSEIWQFAVFIVSLGLGFLLLRFFDKRYTLSKRGKPYLVRIITEAEEAVNG